MNSILNKLNKALKPKDNPAAASSLRHENEAVILDSAMKLLAKSETGAALLSYAQESGTQIHVLRASPDTHGYFPEKSTAYISCPAGRSIPTVRAVIHLVGALRQAAQEASANYKAPQIRQGREPYVKAQIDRTADILVWQAEVIYQIYEATGLLEIIDEFSQMGYGAVYEAYKADIEAASE